MNLFQILSLALAGAEEVLPLFIHNPKSQKIAAVIMTDSASVLGAMQQMQAGPVQPGTLPSVFPGGVGGPIQVQKP